MDISHSTTELFFARYENLLFIHSRMLGLECSVNIIFKNSFRRPSHLLFSEPLSGLDSVLVICDTELVFSPDALISSGFFGAFHFHCK